ASQVARDQAYEHIKQKAKETWGDSFLHVDIRLASDSQDPPSGFDLDLAIGMGRVRTDLNAFSQQESEILLHHGYQCARKIVGGGGKQPTPPASWAHLPKLSTDQCKLIIDKAARTPFTFWTAFTIISAINEALAQ